MTHCHKLYVTRGLLQDMKRRGIKPDVITYRVLIDGRLKVDNFHDAIRLFNEIIDGGLQPDNVTYTALVSGLLNGGHMKKAVIFVQ